MGPKSWLLQEIAFLFSMRRTERLLTPKERIKTLFIVLHTLGMDNDGLRVVLTTPLLSGLPREWVWLNTRILQRSNAWHSTQFCKVWLLARTQTLDYGKLKAKKFKNGQRSRNAWTVIGLLMVKSLQLHFTLATSSWGTKVALNW